MMPTPKGTTDWEQRLRIGLQQQAERAEMTPGMQKRLVQSVIGADAESLATRSTVSPTSSTPFMNEHSWLQRLHDFWHGETEISLRALVNGTGVAAMAVILVVFTALQSVPNLTEGSWETFQVSSGQSPAAEGSDLDGSSYSHTE